MHHIKPMLATLVDEPFDNPEWIFEIKWDGFRALAEVNGNKVELYSRNLLSFNEKFAPVVKALAKLNLHAVLDGEVVILDSKGKSHFQYLQNYQDTGEGHLVYCVFDILFWKGRDLRELELLERKKILKKILRQNSHIKYSDHIVERGKKFFKTARAHGLEGIIAKDIHSPYRSGKRTREWQKIKTSLQQEAVIAGFTSPLGSRKFFGSLILGAYDKGKLIYIGHSGGGFDQKNLESIYRKLKPLIQKESPFEAAPKSKTKSTWVKPRLVCEVGFSEWTSEGQMRHPVFLGLRTDKSAREVRKEIPQ